MFNLTVDYGATLEDLIERGNYAEVDVNIRDGKFPYFWGLNRCTNKSEASDGKKELVFEYVNLGRFINGTDALRQVGSRGFWLANLVELLTFAATSPVLPEYSPIVAYGSEKWHTLSNGFGHVFCPVIHTAPGNVRKLKLESCDYFPAAIQFLCIKAGKT